MNMIYYVKIYYYDYNLFYIIYYISKFIIYDIYYIKIKLYDMLYQNLCQKNLWKWESKFYHFKESGVRVE